MSVQSIVTDANFSIPTYIQSNQSQKGYASQLGAMSHTPIDSPTSTRLGLCSSLALLSQGWF